MGEIVSLSQILYTVDVNSCDLDVESMDASMVRFKLFRKDNDEWIEIQSIGYTVKLRKNEEFDKNMKWIDITIDIIDDHGLMFDVSYMFIVDASSLLHGSNGCVALSHPIYAKSFGNFNIEKNNFMVNVLNTIMFSDNNDNHKVNPYKHWIKMSLLFN